MVAFVTIVCRFLSTKNDGNSSMVNLVAGYVFPSFQYCGIAYTTPRPPIRQVEWHLGSATSAALRETIPTPTRLSVFPSLRVSLPPLVFPELLIGRPITSAVVVNMLYFSP